MQKTLNTHWVTVVTAFALTTAPAWAQTVNFEDLSLAPDSFYNGGPTDNSDGWSSGGVGFGNTFTDFGGGFTGWTGWSYSNVSDTTTPGFGNQYAAYTGSGFGGSGIYAVGFNGNNDFISLQAGQTFESIYVTNTTYAALSMLNGDSFAKKFGDDPSTTGTVETDFADYFSVVFTGFDDVDGTGIETGSVEFFLADYRFVDDADDYVIDDWTLVDLSGLGAARSLTIDFTSSDVGGFGINTPQYVAIDNLAIVPEPTSGLLVLAGLGFILRRHRGRC